MRLRKKPGTAERVLAEKKYFISTPQEHRSKWQEVFTQKQPLALEIGMGGGKFLTGLAARKTHINYLGIEKQERLIEFALQKIKAQELENIKLLWLDANKIDEYIAENEIAYLYLNFSDPWPKNRHAKRRLTARSFLDKYHTILQPQGILEFKTDNVALFEFTLNELLYEKWQVQRVTLDLHKQDYFDGIVTEYEERFSALGQNIYYLKAMVRK